MKLRNSVRLFTCLLSTHADVVYCLFVFLRLRISPPRIKLAASNFARRFIGVPFWGTLLPQKPEIGRIGQRAGHAHPLVNITAEMRRRKRHASEMSRS